MGHELNPSLNNWPNAEVKIKYFNIYLITLFVNLPFHFQCSFPQIGYLFCAERRAELLKENNNEGSTAPGPGKHGYLVKK